MRYIKRLGLLAIAAAALMAFAGTASATTLTSPEGTTYTGEIIASSTNSELDGAFVTVKCGESVAKARTESHGASVTVEGHFTIEFKICNYAITVKATGSFSLHGFSPSTWTVSGLSLSIHTSVGECTFTFNGTQIGTLTGGSPAVLDLNSSKIPRTGGNFLCGSSATWTGSYSVTTPGTLLVD